MNKNQAKEVIKKLIEKYERIKSSKDYKDYSEADTRRDLVMPLFKALGWDVYNDSSREVSEEVDSIRGTVDYQFKINNIPRYLVEAKALSINLDQVKWAKQVLNYGWNKNIPWAVLTDFEGLKVFNSEWNVEIPHAVIDLSYRDYLEKFEKLWLLSKESMLKNELEISAAEWGVLSKRVNVGEKLVKDLIEWRDDLSKNLISWNKDKYSKENIDEAVQRILDRLIFIRVAEDKKLEPHTLWPALQKWLKNDRKPYNFMQSLTPIFKDFDEIYNSNLFKHHVCDDLETEGQPFEKIINELYEDKNEEIKYRFDLINSDILGSVYENYLGYRLSESKKGLSVGKAAARRKEQGIYYTPTFVVDYMVRNALKPVLDRCRDVDDLKKIKVLDPACGSGSFLTKAMEVILEKYQEFNYKDDENLRTQILLENIFGVDLDEQAVEISRLNLLLNTLRQRRKLPSLDKNIQTGNSLISGSDSELKKYLGKDYSREKPFNWEERFPEVFKQNGFDVVIGNPPYISAISMKKNFSLGTREFLKSHYKSASGAYDIYLLFFERGINLLKDDGYLSYISPNKFLSASYAISFREFVIKNCQLEKIVDLSNVKVFLDASTYPIISLYRKNKDANYSIETTKLRNGNLTDFEKGELEVIKNSSKYLSLLPDNIWGFLLSNHLELLKKLLINAFPLEELIHVSATSTAAEADEYSQLISDKQEPDSVKVINTGTIDRYISLWGIKEISSKSKKTLYPYLNLGSNLISERRKQLYLSPKIIIAKLGLNTEAFLDLKGEYASLNTNCLYSPNEKKISLNFFIGVVNSKIFNFIYEQFFSSLRMGGGYFQYQAPQLRVIPIRKPSKEQDEKFRNLVKDMLALGKEKQKSGRGSSNWDSIEIEMERVDEEIDKEVYKLYGLTSEEIKIVENSAR